MNNIAIVPKSNTALGNHLLRQLQTNKSVRPQRSVGVLTSHTTEGVLRRAKRTDESVGSRGSIVPRWG